MGGMDESGGGLRAVARTQRKQDLRRGSASIWLKIPKKSRRASLTLKFAFRTSSSGSLFQ